jgi:hypothetical protein
MMTALVFADGAPEELAATLAALIPAVVEGLVGDAVIVSLQPKPVLTGIAEVAGAKFVIASPDADPWRTGAAHARREWLLCLESGDVPAEGWMRAVDRFLAGSARAGQPLARFSRRQAGPSAALVDLAERVMGTRTVRAGDLVRRDWLMAGDPARMRSVRIGAAIERDVVLR